MTNHKFNLIPLGRGRWITGKEASHDLKSPTRWTLNPPIPLWMLADKVLV